MQKNSDFLDIIETLAKQKFRQMKKNWQEKKILGVIVNGNKDS